MAEADAAGLRVTRGGRFWHLMGRSSKAQAIDTMRNLYAADNDSPLTVIALGDSENDRGMLQRADIAVVIKRHDGTHLDCHGIETDTVHRNSRGRRAGIPRSCRY